MRRREFLKEALPAAAGAGVALRSAARPLISSSTKKNAVGEYRAKRPRAITMWEFSWIERRWDGAGYQDWEKALDELEERGYNAVRIDPFPHLLATDSRRTWTLLPEWNTQLWGSPDVNRIAVMPALTDFIGKCHRRNVKVGLSTWYRQDQDNTRMTITGPEIMAAQWIKTLDIIHDAGLLDTILYVDLCNEWPGKDWAPFLRGGLSYGDWQKPESLAWMHTAIALVREKYHDLPLLFSFGAPESATGPATKPDLSNFDLLDPHIWMAQQNGSEFYKLVDYHYERFDPRGYTNLSLKAEETYRARSDYWQGLLTQEIDRLASVSKSLSIPLITTECWGIVDYKDWPLLKWDWVKDVCVLGARRAVNSGQWLAVATSNFCGPQFVGMWRDAKWHRELTQMIRSAELRPELQAGRLYQRL